MKKTNNQREFTIEGVKFPKHTQYYIYDTETTITIANTRSIIKASYLKWYYNQKKERLQKALDLLHTQIQESLKKTP